MLVDISIRYARSTITNGDIGRNAVSMGLDWSYSHYLSTRPKKKTNCGDSYHEELEETDRILLAQESQKAVKSFKK